MKIGRTKDLQKIIDRHGSVLKGYIVKDDRTFKMILRALILTGGFVLLLQILFNLLFSHIKTFNIIFAIMYIWLLMSGGIFLKNRTKNYLSFYQTLTGYTAEELQLADREFMGAGAVCIVSRTDRAKEDVLFIVTEHYFMSVWPIRGCYVLKLEDIAAVFYSCRIPEYQGLDVQDVSGYLEGLHIISKQDTQDPGEVRVNGKELSGFTNTLATDQAICMEVIEEITKRMPHVITSQNIVVNDIQYDLINLENWQEDWKKILKELA